MAHATDRHCHQMQRINKIGAKNINLSTTTGEKNRWQNFMSVVVISPPAKSHCLVPLNGPQYISKLSINTSIFDHTIW